MTGRKSKIERFLKPLRLAVLTILACHFTTCDSDHRGPYGDISERISFVLYDGLSETITDPILTKLEDNYARVMSDLDVGDDSRTIVIRIWGNDAHFQQSMQADLGVTYPGATGYIFNAYEIRVLHVGNTAQTVLHEFCHTVSMHVNSRIPNNPRWLWEAVAIYEAGERVDPKSLSYLVSGNFPTLDQLNTGYNSGAQFIYQVGYILSEYIIQTYGRAKFIQLIKTNGNIASTLGITTSKFESGWKKFVQSRYLN